MVFLRLINILFLIGITEQSEKKCTTPNNEVAECISLYACPVLSSVLATRDNASIEFVRKSNCGGTAIDPLVCCGSSSSFTQEPSTTQSPHSSGNKEQLSDRTYCGYQHSDDYVHAGNTINLHEFPWLAGLVYQVENKLKTRCGGSLISSRYVLTTAFCVKAKPGLIAVRLGEYNRKNETDCVGEDSHDYECSEPPQDFGIEKQIVHPQYDARRFKNDIALLKLNASALYSDYVRVICLPTPGYKSAQVGDVVTTTGWGRIGQGKEQTEVKKKILAKIKSNEECFDIHIRYSFYLTENSLCANLLESDISCVHDNGGPIMFSYKNQWQREGLLSLPLGCFSGPDVYTKVVNYVDWIKENTELTLA